MAGKAKLKDLRDQISHFPPDGQDRCHQILHLLGLDAWNEENNTSTYRQLKEVSRRLVSSQWEKKYSVIAVKLGIPNEEISAIRRCWNNDYRHIFQEMLKLWKERTGGYKVDLATVVVEVEDESAGTPLSKKELRERELDYWNKKKQAEESAGPPLSERELRKRSRYYEDRKKQGTATATTSTTFAPVTTNITSLSPKSSANDEFDDILEMVAKELHKKIDIDSLGKILGFNPGDIGRCIDENEKQGGNYMGTLDMLRKWRQKQAAAEEREALRNALQKAGMIIMADRLLGTSPSEFTSMKSAQKSVPPRQPSNIQQTFYDIYLVYSEETEHVEKVKTIIQNNRWKMTTPHESELGVPKFDSIEKALKTCSHVILIVTKEDCEENGPEWTMIINMVFSSSDRLIPIRCCDEKHLPHKLKSLTNACIIDANLEYRLKKSIDVSIRYNREGKSSRSDDSSYASPS